MPQIEVTLPDQINDQIDRLVEQGDFLNRDQAIEELLSMGVSTYDMTDEEPEMQGEDMFTQAVDDQTDPAIRDEQGDDGRTF